MLRPTLVLNQSLLVEVDCVSEARLHLWYLVTDDFHQHFRELHLQRLGLAEGVETEVQQVPDQLENRNDQRYLNYSWPFFFLYLFTFRCLKKSTKW